MPVKSCSRTVRCVCLHACKDVCSLLPCCDSPVSTAACLLQQRNQLVCQATQHAACQRLLQSVSLTHAPRFLQETGLCGLDHVPEAEMARSGRSSKAPAAGGRKAGAAAISHTRCCQHRCCSTPGRRMAVSCLFVCTCRQVTASLWPYLRNSQFMASVSSSQSGLAFFCDGASSASPVRRGECWRLLQGAGGACGALALADCAACSNTHAWCVSSQRNSEQPSQSAINWNYNSCVSTHRFGDIVLIIPGLTTGPGLMCGVLSRQVGCAIVLE